jgi:hypothetical protein
VAGLSKTEIANLALVALGQGLQIDDYDSDGSAAGKAIRQVYPVAVKIALGETDWFFARKTVSLSLFSDPDEEYSDTWEFAYHIPSDLIEFRGIEASGTLKPEWELWDGDEVAAAGLIVTDEEDAVGRYTFFQQNEARYPMWFCELLALKIAELAVPALIPGDYAKRLEVIHTRYLKALGTAKARNFNADRTTGVPASEAEQERS